MYAMYSDKAYHGREGLVGQPAQSSAGQVGLLGVRDHTNPHSLEPQGR